jgi:prophage regulatory protein
MPSVFTRNTTIPNPSQLKSDDHLVPSCSPQVVRRILQSQKPFGTERNGISSDPDEVIFLRLPRVKAVTGLSKSSLYELIRANSFPAPVHLGARTVAWVASEVKQWAAERILSSRTPAPSAGGRRMPQRVLPGQWRSKKWA